MKSFGIKNLRGLTDTGDIELKSLNILVGANSSGKSTYLRAFPLLKQGFEVRKKGPVLWYGEEIDFGDFATALRSGADSIDFSITGQIAPNSYREERFILEKTEYTVSFSIRGKSENEYISNIIISCEDNTIALEIDADHKIIKLNVNGSDIEDIEDLKIYEGLSMLIPQLGVMVNLTNTQGEKRRVIMPAEKRLRPLLYDFLKNLTNDNRVGDATIHMIANSLPLTNSANLLQHIKRHRNAPSSLAKATSRWTVETKAFQKLRNLVAYGWMSALLNSIDQSLSEYFQNSYYIAPLRATAQRYYRVQNLAVQNVDSQGQNLPLFLNNLTKSQSEKFKEWMSNILGFYPEPTKSVGHISVSLISSSDETDNFNVADRGFGYSQILPILTMLWDIVFSVKSRSRMRRIERNNIPIYVSIEQPELHLHPSLSKKMTDAFISIISSAKEMGIELKLIIETHSSAIVNKVGQNIAEGKIASLDVNVILFDSKLNNEQKNTRIASFNEEGFLENWPIGFFD